MDNFFWLMVVASVALCGFEGGKFYERQRTAPPSAPVAMIPWTLHLDGNGCIYLPDYDDGVTIFKENRLCSSMKASQSAKTGNQGDLK